MAASWHHCVEHCLSGAAEHKENIVSVQVYLLLVASAPGCVNLLFECENVFFNVTFGAFVCFALLYFNVPLFCVFN